MITSSMVQRLTAKEIEDRLSHISDDVLEDIENDVLFNYDRIMLPGFPKGLNWNDEQGFFSPSYIGNSKLLPETRQWLELEDYAKDVGITLNELYQLLGMYPTGKLRSNEEYDWARRYISGRKNFLSTIGITKRAFETTVVSIDNDMQNPESRRAWVVDNKCDYRARLQKG